MVLAHRIYFANFLVFFQNQYSKKYINTKLDGFGFKDLKKKSPIFRMEDLLFFKT
jgi:hypothetical protein